MRTFLAQGLIVHMRRKLFSKVGVRVLAAFMIVGLVALGVALVQTLLKIITVIAPRSLSTHFERVRTQITAPSFCQPHNIARGRSRRSPL